MLNEADLNIILEAIENKKCILFLGPEINNLKENISVEEALSEYLGSQGIKLNFYKDEGLYLFDEHTSFPKLSYNIKQFYSNLEIPPIYEQIAKIPFHLVLSITPDLFLDKTFEKYNFDRNCSVYNKVENPENIVKSTKESPLLYYLFGSYEKFESLMLTHDDLFNFLVAILSKHELPVELSNLILDAHNFIFLGFRFDHWYVQILLRLFNSKVKPIYTKFSIGRYALSKSIKPTTRAFCIDEFRMTFIDDGIQKFVDQLFDAHKKSGKLRIPVNKELSIVKQLESCVEKGDLNKAFNCLLGFLDKKIPGKNKDEIDNLIRQNSGIYEDLKRRQNEQTLDSAEFTKERNKIQRSVLDLIKEIKGLLKS